MRRLPDPRAQSHRPLPPPAGGRLPSAATEGCQPNHTLSGGRKQCAWFEVDGANTTEITAVTNDPTTLLLKWGKATKPRQIQYAWGNFPVAMVWGEEGGLPASPFYLNIVQ